MRVRPSGHGSMKERTIFYIERLTGGVVFFSVFPYIIRQILKGGHHGHTGIFIDASRIGLLAAKCILPFFSTNFERLDFRLIDIVDEMGLSLRLRIEVQDLVELQRSILNSSEVKKALSSYPLDPFFNTYFSKEAVSINLREDTMGRAVFLIQVAVWKNRVHTKARVPVVFFMYKRVFISAIQHYARNHGVLIFPAYRFSPWPIQAIKFFFYSRLHWLKNGYKDFCKNGIRGVARQLAAMRSVRSSSASEKESIKLGLEYNGNLHLKNPQLYSDLFFLQQSKFLGKDTVLIFSMPADPMDEAKYGECMKEGITVAVLDPRATTVPSFPVFYHHSDNPPPRYRRFLFNRDPQTRYIAQRFQSYTTDSNYWYDFFQRHNIKLFLSWYKYDGKHISIANALQKYGGVSAVYQRALEDFSSPRIMTVADVVFGFSNDSFEILRNSGSRISYHVATGYIGDHRAPLLRESAKIIRNELLSHGAHTIIAFFDENASEDDRWHAGYKFFQENYAFILEQVMKNPRLGLVIKPKGPLVLRRRLGSIAELLGLAERTGRCKVIGEGIVHGSTPPVCAALAADIAIHGHLCAGTAGFESALAGVPTLLLDREGWNISPLYKLGLGRVVFRSWEDLWEGIREYCGPSGVTGFGDWSPILDSMDPFRDGKAAERMGTYLKWILDGLKQGSDRDTVLADAAEKYAKIWGGDKIIHI